MSKKSSLDKLVDEALENARQDRKAAIGAYEKVSGSLDMGDDDKVKDNMLIGERPIKLLEQASRANEQLVKLAQIREREESRKKDETKKPYDIGKLMEEAEEEGVELGKDVKTRVGND